MYFRFGASLQYHAAYICGQKELDKIVKKGIDVHPEELKRHVYFGEDVKTEELGVIDIPTELIIGVADKHEKEFYSTGFKPLFSAECNPAKQWCQLYKDYRRNKAFDTPIECYEYLGRFYIVDGKKRISVLKYLGIPAVSAYVTRILPTSSDETRVQIYNEFIESFKLTRLYQVSFSQLGSFARLQEAMGHAADQEWSDEEREFIRQDLSRITHALKAAFGGYLNVTSADALLVLLEKRSLKQIRKMAVLAMTDCIQHNWKKFYTICHPDIELNDEKMMRRAS